MAKTLNPFDKTKRELLGRSAANNADSVMRHCTAAIPDGESVKFSPYSLACPPTSGRRAIAFTRLRLMRRRLPHRETSVAKLFSD
ncbi:hypothetical protein [Bordetella genomosp. 13]|uniref:hypothetical protein n=1 Tax=Bordetella genomosp. 13 TaxID=463040 RepID=UPI001642E082|nr:hypothetical protein [Bordetella genomosp. 13]